MSTSKTVSGARCKLGIINPATGTPDFKGFFNNVSFGLTYDAQPVFILGRYGPADIEYTAQEAVSITASGWRIYGHGAHADAGLPALQDLLNAEYLTLVIVDRVNPNKALHTFKNVRATGYSTTISNRNLEEITVTFIGINVDDESTANAEGEGHMDLP